jgi:adenylate kinase family enzyme
MKSNRIHLFGASGSGVTTLGRALAVACAIPHHDTDDYYWTPTTPPYKIKREIADRLRLMQDMFLPRADWVLSGALDSWGSSLVQHFDAAVFVDTPADIRLARLAVREATRFGQNAVRPGGWRHPEATEFLEWASHYDDGTVPGRSRARHEAFIATLPCPLLRVDGSQPVTDNVSDILNTIGRPT